MAKNFRVTRGWVPGSFLLKVQFEVGNPKFVHLTREELEELRGQLTTLLNHNGKSARKVLGNHGLPHRKLHVT
jgi:hypothetical protein